MGRSVNVKARNLKLEHTGQYLVIKDTNVWHTIKRIELHESGRVDVYVSWDDKEKRFCFGRNDNVVISKKT